MKLSSVTTGLVAAWCVAMGAPAAAQFTFEQGDRVAFIGNALPDRMQHDGWLETYLQLANPDKELVIRNLGFTGDSVASRPRNENFMPADEYLTHVEADVVFAFFGYNESFRRDPEAFKEELTAFIEETREKEYNGESAPRIVLVSPIAFENLRTPHLPNGEEHNKWLSIYADAMASVARRNRVAFVDLYYPSEALYEELDQPLTINGVHLNDLGNKTIALEIVSQLHGAVEFENVELVRQAVLDKNWNWFNRYRATDGNDIWGTRAPLKFVDGQTNEEVLQHELVMLDIMAANRDKVIWDAIEGRTTKPDDSNVPDPVMVKTNLEPAPEKRAEDGGHAFVKPEDGVDTLTLEEGMVANLFASEEMFPELVNPVQMDVDTQGRLWVAAWETYPKWQPDQDMLDRLLILPDEDRDGVADEAKTFAFVHNPTGFTFWNGGVIVASAPDIWYFKDTDGDDVADYKEVWFSGIDSSDTHHSANGFDYGPDGYIYYQRGIFNVSNVETPWEAPQLSGASAMYRFNPRTFRFSYHAANPPNPHGGDFNYWGYHFATDATGGNAFQVRMDGDGKFKMHKLLEKTVRPVPSSGIISSTHFPDDKQGNYIILNSIGFLGIKQYTLENTDGEFWGTETDDLLVSSDSNFRPTDFKFGDDGALYVADWSNPIIGHMQHNVRDPNRDHEHGRIYRITVEGRPLEESVAIDGEPIEALLDVLKHPTNGVRLRARIELSERDTADVIAAVQTWTKQFDADSEDDAHHLLEALWLHQQFDVVNEPLLNALLESPHPDARRAAERVKYLWDIEGKFDDAPAIAEAAPPQDAEAILAASREYLKQKPSPEPKMDGDVFVLHIQTLIEQMRYDRTVFTVPAGQKVRLVFSNPDAMDHNLIMVEPNSAAKVALAAAEMEKTGIGPKKQWRPDSEEILFASALLARGEREVIEFTAPMTPGRYEYICTFPGHWQLMRGAMVVKESIDESLVALNALKEETIEVQARPVVETWQFDMLKDGVGAVLANRSFETGKAMFHVAACVKCHTIAGHGGAIGPDLTDARTRHTPVSLLESILDPSLAVEDAYKTYVVELKNGVELYGQIIGQNEDTITLLDNPLQPEFAETVKASEVKEKRALDMSPMPTDLLITLNKEEIWDLMAYVLSGGDPKAPAFN